MLRKAHHHLNATVAAGFLGEIREHEADRDTLTHLPDHRDKLRKVSSQRISWEFPGALPSQCRLMGGICGQM